MDKKKNKKKTTTKKTDSNNLSKIKSLNKEIKDIGNSLKECEEKNLRLMAEFENFKKRKERSVQDSYNRNLETIILKFLPVIDDFERMLNNDNNKEKTLKEGISIIQSKFEKILDNYGVTSFNSKNEIFDADLHEAVMAQNSNKKNNLIIDEFEKGYKMNDKVIRHAKVIVSKGKKWEITMIF